ncbi:MAG: DUF4118 domain-containing protein [Pyrinomonadaceae bacterium]
MRTLAPTAKGFISLATVGLVTVGFAPFAETISHTTVALAYLLAILFVATLFGSRPALASSVAGALCFNFFFLPPYFTFAVSQGENWVALAAFLVTAVVAGQLSSYARRRADESEARRQEIEQLYSDLREAFAQASQAEALRQSEQMKSALLDAVTHDLRTPLTSIKAAATTLMETGIDLGDESRRDLLAIIDEEAERLNAFIGGIVDLARIEAGQLDLKRSGVPVTEIISRAVERASARLSGREVVIEVPPQTPDVRVDGQSAEEALYSLIENASKYSPDDAPIRLSAIATPTRGVEIIVEDKGRGIAPEDRERIFEKFIRVGRAEIHSTASGLGLGLAIARGLAESMGGSVTAGDGRDGYVTAFTLTLPAAGPTIG